MSFNELNYIDYITILIILISAGFGVYRGFITSAVSLMGWVLSIILTYQFYPSVEEHLMNYFKSKVLVVIIGSGGLLILLLVIFAILNYILYKIIGKIKRNFLDRIIGFIFGLVRGVMIISLLFLCFSVSFKLLVGKKHDMKDDDYPKVVTEAATYHLMQGGADALENMLPKSFHKRFEKIFSTVSKDDEDNEFVKISIEKLSRFASQEQIKSINLKRQELKYEDTQEMIDIKTVGYLFEIYNEKIKANEIEEKVLSKQEIEKLERIIKNSLN